MRFQQKRCVACGWPKATGMISFGNKLHEPHCDACCKAFTLFLKLGRALSATTTLQEFRAWQAIRKEQMGVPA